MDVKVGSEWNHKRDKGFCVVVAHVLNSPFYSNHFVCVVEKGNKNSPLHIVDKEVFLENYEPKKDIPKVGSKWVRNGYEFEVLGLVKNEWVVWFWPYASGPFYKTPEISSLDFFLENFKPKGV